MKVLIIGNGGREHAIAWKLSQSPLVDNIYCVLGNGGTDIENKCENVNLSNIEDYIQFAEKNCDVTIVGPEAPLVEGIADKFKSLGLKIFGPSKKGAMLEGSKAFAKDFMKKYNVKTADYEVFDDAKEALEHIYKCLYPCVIKADGLAAGKGVVICKSFEEAKQCIENFMIYDALNGSGKRIVIEEYLQGVEASILTVTDGKTIIPLLSAKDHKTIFEGNKGPNTGGMGAVAPNPYCTLEVLDSFKKDIMYPTLEGIIKEEIDYTGVIFFGIMITKKGVYNLEYNVRMGDPETQAVLPLMESDYMELIQKALDGDLSGYNIKWKNKHSCTVVAASSGYPKEYKTGFIIEGINDVDDKVFIAGAKYENNKFITSGGRVLAVTSLGDNLEEARLKAYDAIHKINFEGIYYRKDIGAE